MAKSGKFPLNDDHMQNTMILKILIIKIVQFIKLLNSERLIYANLKPENVWLSLDKSIELKLADYSQTIAHDKLKLFKLQSISTLEYFPPEIIEYIRSRNLYKRGKSAERMKCPQH
jgi:serine/threonine protein kinase